MVARASEGININSGQQVEARNSGVGAKRPDYAKYTTASREAAPINTADSSADRILDQVLNVAGKLSDVMWERSKEEAYLDGVAKAGTIQNEQELEGNLLTRQWQKAGYRDTMGRVAQADYEASIAADMPKLRERGPEEFQQYMAEKRRGLLESFEGMSLTARQGAFAQVMLNERAAIKKHGSEHYKFVREQELKSIQAVHRVTVSELNSSKDNAEVYDVKTAAAFGNTYTSVIRNEKLNDAERASLVKDFAEYALQSDNQKLYKMLLNVPLTHLDGSERPAMSLLSFDDEIKVDEKYRASVKRTEVLAAHKWNVEGAQMQAQWDDANAPYMPEQQVRDHLLRGMKEGWVKEGQDGVFMAQYYKANAKKLYQGDLAQAWANGDSGKIHSLDKTDADGADAWMAQYGSRMPRPAAIGALADIGARTGQLSAFKTIGKVMAPDFAQMISGDGTTSEATALTVGKLFQTINKFEVGMREGAMAQLIAALPEDAQIQATLIREEIRNGKSPANAISIATGRILEHSKAGVTGATRTDIAKEDRSVLDELDGRGIWESLGSVVASTVSKDSKSNLAINPWERWWENPVNRARSVAATKLSVAEELRIISMQEPLMSKDSRKTLALSRVAGRTVMMEDGPLIVPRGQSIKGFFGVEDNVGSEDIAQVLQTQVKPVSEGGRIKYSIVNGTLRYEEYNKHGVFVNDAVLDPKQVPAMLKARDVEVGKDFSEKAGVGRTVERVVDGVKVKVTFSGNNSASVGNDSMFKFRERLVEHEGVRGGVYKDLSGNINKKTGQPVQTVGVGVSDTNDYFPKPGPDGKISQAQINESFMLASNAAAKLGQQAMLKTGTKSTAAFQLFAELAYQAGPQVVHSKTYAPLRDAIAKKDKAAALAALRSTEAWKLAGDSKRRKFYEQSIEEILKG